MAETYQDREVVGLDREGRVVQWNAAEGKPYSSGVALADWGIHNLREKEIERVGVRREQWAAATAQLGKLTESIDRYTICKGWYPFTCGAFPGSAKHFRALYDDHQGVITHLELWSGSGDWYRDESIEECKEQLMRALVTGGVLKHDAAEVSELMCMPTVELPSWANSVDQSRKLQQCRYEIGFSRGATLSGWATVENGKVVLPEEAEAEIERRWSTPVTGAVIYLGGRKLMLETQQDGWVVGEDLGSDESLEQGEAVEATDENAILAQNLREQALVLMQQAEQLDGMKLYPIVSAYQYVTGGIFCCSALTWSNHVPSDVEAAAIIGLDAVPSPENTTEKLVVEAPLALHQAAGTRLASRLTSTFDPDPDENSRPNRNSSPSV